MSKIESFWIVQDPTNVSELPDVVFTCTTTTLANFIVGSSIRSNGWTERNSSIHTSEESALRDLRDRIVRIRNHLEKLHKTVEDRIHNIDESEEFFEKAAGPHQSPEKFE